MRGLLQLYCSMSSSDEAGDMSLLEDTTALVGRSLNTQSLKAENDSKRRILEDFTKTIP